VTIREFFGFKPYKVKKPKATHPWKQAAFVAVEEKKAHKRSERDWRASIVASRDRMGVRA
jgi:hypothetical protein